MQSKLVWYSVQEKLVVTESDTPIGKTTHKSLWHAQFFCYLFYRVLDFIH